MGHEFEPVTYGIFGACIAVQRQLGAHCMEVDYQRALEIELAARGLEHFREAEIPICYNGIEVTRRRADFVIWDATHTVLLETKAAKAIRPEDVEQCQLYLRNGNFRVCLLANFGVLPLGKNRFVWTPAGPALYGPHK
jgi:GxxExxY protein